MALGARFSQSSVVAFASNHIDRYDAVASFSNSNEDSDLIPQKRDSEVAGSSYGNGGGHATASMAYLPRNAVLCDLRHEAYEAYVSCGPTNSVLVSKWRPKDQDEVASEWLRRKRGGLLGAFGFSVDVEIGHALPTKRKNYFCCHIKKGLLHSCF